VHPYHRRFRATLSPHIGAELVRGQKEGPPQGGGGGFTSRTSAGLLCQAATDVEEDRPERGLYLTGVGRLREILDSSSEDPCDVVHTALHRVGSASFYTKIVPVFPSSKLRKDVDQVIVYFSSVYHRKYASAELRRFFAREKILRVSLRDLFEKSDVELAKKMTKLGFQLKQEAKICRFRVSNVRGVPILFCAGQDRKYSEMDKRTMQAKLDAMN